MASQRRILITPYFERSATARHDGYRIKLVASDGNCVPNEIFAYRELPLQPGQAETLGFFSHVCSSVDLEEFPVGSPRVNTTPPWFRLDTIDLVLRSRSECMDLYLQVLSDVKSLTDSMDIQDDLEAQPPILIGNVPVFDGSGSADLESVFATSGEGTESSG